MNVHKTAKEIKFRLDTGQTIKFNEYEIWYGCGYYQVRGYGQTAFKPTLAGLKQALSHIKRGNKYNVEHWGGKKLRDGL